MDLLLTRSEHVLRRNVADGTVQADVVVMLNVARHQTPRIVQRQWRPWPDAFAFERFVPTFDLAVRLRIVGRSPDVGHTRDPKNSLKSLAMNCGPLSEMIRGFASGCSSLARS